MPTDREEVLVGLAAATFPAHGCHNPDRPIAPAPEQRWAFVRAFERTRGTVFTPEQHRLILAASTWVIAYNARVMHAFGMTRPGPGTPALALRELADEVAGA